MTSTLPQCLTIAGSDSGGGAGIQADLKTFQANGVFGMSVLTSITAQNTQRVTRAFDLPEDLILAQLQAVFEDFAVAAVKTGMLSSKGIVSAVSAFWRSLGPGAPPLVVDPVMVSKSGYPLLQLDAVSRIRRELLPLATLVTPNRNEAELISGLSLASREDVEAAGRKILALGPKAVLLKGGHLDGKGLDPSRATDYLFTGGAVQEFSSPRIDTTSTHGTGCTYSAAIAAWLGRGFSVSEAVGRAKTYLDGAIRHGLDIGHGHGPTHHFFFLTDWMKTAPAAKKAGAKETSTGRAGTKKAAAKKSSSAKRPATAARKAGGKAPAARKAGAKKANARRAGTKNAAAKKAVTKQATAKKLSTATRPARRKSAPRPTTVKKTRRSR